MRVIAIAMREVISNVIHLALRKCVRVASCRDEPLQETTLVSTKGTACDASLLAATTLWLCKVVLGRVVSNLTRRQWVFYLLTLLGHSIPPQHLCDLPGRRSQHAAFASSVVDSQLAGTVRQQ